MAHNHKFQQQQPEPQPETSLSAVTSAISSCAICNSDDNWILHNHIELRTSPKKLCTCCLLKLYPASFCPTCLNLHDRNSLNPQSLSSSSSSSLSNRYLTCLKCNSFSHITCVPPNSPKSPYLCPPCSNPSFKYFDFKKPRKTQIPDTFGGADGIEKAAVEEHQQKQVVMDERSAKVLLLAAKMSEITMSRAASTAKLEAEKKVKDAALARKRAKEAIDYVMALSNKLGNVKPQRRDVGAVNNGNNHNVVSKSNQSPGAKNFIPVKVENNGGNGNVTNGTVAVVVVAPNNGGNVVDINNHHVGKEGTAG